MSDGKLPSREQTALIDAVRDYAILMLDVTGHVSSWNEGARLMKGYEAPEILGQHFSRFYTPDDAAAGRPQALLAAAVRDGRVEDEGWRVRKDGSRFWADVVITARRDQTGELVGFTKVTRDLTERKGVEERLRRSEERFRLLVEGVTDYAIFMLDPNGHVVTWNTGAERINGYRADEIVGQHFSRFYPDERVRAGVCERELEIAKREGRFEEEGWRIRKDGSKYCASVVITALYDEAGHLYGFGKVTRDLTERLKLEAERLRSAQAEEAIRMRDEFLSIASHELKTPLTVLQLQLQSLRARVEAMDEKIVSRVERANAGSDRLAELVETLLDVSRIASGSFELKREPFDLGEITRAVLDRLREAATGAGCQLSLDARGSVLGLWDRMRIEQVLMNLISNCMKYGKGTPIDVEVALEADRAVLRVTDHGPGIPEADLGRIFGRFERAASMRNYGGLGLGLYVTRQIVEAHGGDVLAENIPGKGARFIVRLPLRPATGVGTANRTSKGLPS